MLKRSHVRQFLAVVDAGSFTEAARRLRITQPTLSAGIADLERLMGARLFDRRRNGIQLTPRGGAFLGMARDLENRFREADSFGHDAPPLRQSLRLGSIRTVTSAFLSSLVSLLGNVFEVELQEGSDYNLRAALKNRQLDMALTILRPFDDEYRAWVAFEEPYTMLAHVDHRLAGRNDVSPSELASETMIARRSCEALTETSRFFVRHGVRPKFAFKSDNDERCLSMVAAGLGLTTAPASLATAEMLPIGVSGYELARQVGLLIDPTFPAADEVMNALNALTEGKHQDDARFAMRGFGPP